MPIIKGNEIIVSTGSGGGSSQLANSLYVRYINESDWVPVSSSTESTIYEIVIEYDRYLYALGNNLLYNIYRKVGDSYEDYHNLLGAGYTVNIDSNGNFRIRVEYQELFEGKVVIEGVNAAVDTTLGIDTRTIYIKEFTADNWVARLGEEDTPYRYIYVPYNEYAEKIGTCLHVTLYKKVEEDDSYISVAALPDMTYNTKIRNGQYVELRTTTDDLYAGRAVLIGAISLSGGDSNKVQEVSFNVTLSANMWTRITGGGYYQDVRVFTDYTNIKLSLAPIIANDTDIENSKRVINNYVRIGNMSVKPTYIRFICFYDKPVMDLELQVYGLTGVLTSTTT